MSRTRKHPDDEVMIARDSGVVVVDGVEEFVRRGISRAHRGHPIVQAAPDLWEPIGVHFAVETTTAAPGETREMVAR